MSGEGDEMEIAHGGAKSATEGEALARELSAGSAGSASAGEREWEHPQTLPSSNMSTSTIVKEEEQEEERLEEVTCAEVKQEPADAMWSVREETADVEVKPDPLSLLPLKEEEGVVARELVEVKEEVVEEWEEEQEQPGQWEKEQPAADALWDTAVKREELVEMEEVPAPGPSSDYDYAMIAAQSTQGLDPSQQSVSPMQARRGRGRGWADHYNVQLSDGRQLTLYSYLRTDGGHYFPCPLCPNGYMSEHGRRTHLWKVHDVADKTKRKEKTVIKKKPTKPKPYQRPDGDLLDELEATVASALRELPRSAQPDHKDAVGECECGVRFGTRKLLLQHRSVKHGEGRSREEEEVEEKEEEEPRWKRELAARVVAEQQKLLQKEAKKEAERMRGLFPCPHCVFIGVCEAGLNTHLQARHAIEELLAKNTRHCILVQAMPGVAFADVEEERKRLLHEEKQFWKEEKEYWEQRSQGLREKQEEMERQKQAEKEKEEQRRLAEERRREWEEVQKANEERKRKREEKREQRRVELLQQVRAEAERDPRRRSERNLAKYAKDMEAEEYRAAKRELLARRKAETRAAADAIRQEQEQATRARAQQERRAQEGRELEEECLQRKRLMEERKRKEWEAQMREWEQQQRCDRQMHADYAAMMQTLQREREARQRQKMQWEADMREWERTQRESRVGRVSREVEKENEAWSGGLSEQELDREERRAAALQRWQWRRHVYGIDARQQQRELEPVSRQDVKREECQFLQPTSGFELKPDRDSLPPVVLSDVKEEKELEQPERPGLWIERRDVKEELE